MNKRERVITPTSRQVKNLFIHTAIGGTLLLSSTVVTAATVEFLEGPIIDVTALPQWSGVGTDFTVNLVAKDLQDITYGGGFGLTYDPSLVNITGTTVDSFWTFFAEGSSVGGAVPLPTTIDGTTGYYEMNLGQTGFSTVFPVQGLLSIDFTVVGLGEFDFGFSSTGIAGEWIYEPNPPIPAVPGDPSYCLTTDSVIDAETVCFDPITSPVDPVNGEDRLLLTMVSSHVVVPVPAAVWLFGSGLIGLVAVSRRKAA